MSRERLSLTADIVFGVSIAIFVILVLVSIYLFIIHPLLKRKTDRNKPSIEYTEEEAREAAKEDLLTLAKIDLIDHFMDPNKHLKEDDYDDDLDDIFIAIAAEELDETEEKPEEVVTVQPKEVEEGIVS